MSERWRSWEPPLAIEPVEQGIWLPDGRSLGEYQITWSKEQIERFRAGYKCVKCLEPQERAWPERCWCWAPMCWNAGEQMRNRSWSAARRRAN